MYQEAEQSKEKSSELEKKLSKVRYVRNTCTCICTFIVLVNHPCMHVYTVCMCI